MIRATISERPIRATVNGEQILARVQQRRITAKIGGYVAISGGVVSTLSLSALSPLSALRAIAVDASGNAVYADPATSPRAVGISTTAGTTVSVQYAGELTDALWTWTPDGVIYVSANGALTQTAPTSGTIQPIARALTATRILITIHPTIQVS